MQKQRGKKKEQKNRVYKRNFLSKREPKLPFEYKSKQLMLNCTHKKKREEGLKVYPQKSEFKENMREGET